MTQRRFSTFASPAHFYECPRWHDGCWWVSDMRGGTVYRFDGEGRLLAELAIDGRPGGLGWAGNGSLLVVSMDARQLLRFAADGVTFSARIDLGPLLGDVDGFANDMAVAPGGHIYIGFDPQAHRYGTDSLLGKIVHVAPTGEAAIVAQDLAFPNGMVVTPDGATLVVAETMAARLTGFALQPDGTLGPARIWGSVDPGDATRTAGGADIAARPVNLDGCAIDAQGHVWAADVGSGCLRVAPGRAVTDAVFLPDGLRAFACALGGPDGRTLLICGADDNFADRTSRRESYLFATTVDVPAA